MDQLMRVSGWEDLSSANGILELSYGHARLWRWYSCLLLVSRCCWGVRVAHVVVVEAEEEPVATPTSVLVTTRLHE